MKKILTVILAALMLTLAIIPAAQAEEVANVAETYETDSTTVEYFEDGSYMVTTIKESPVTRSARSKSYVKVGVKTINLYDSDDVLQWTYELTGRFQVVEGESAVCIESSYTSNIYVKAWSLTAHNNYTRSNIAFGTATYKKKVLFITTSTQDIDASIGCDINGNVG